MWIIYHIFWLMGEIVSAMPVFLFLGENVIIKPLIKFFVVSMYRRNSTESIWLFYWGLEEAHRFQFMQIELENSWRNKMGFDFFFCCCWRTEMPSSGSKLHLPHPKRKEQDLFRSIKKFIGYHLKVGIHSLCVIFLPTFLYYIQFAIYCSFSKLISRLKLTSSFVNVKKMTTILFASFFYLTRNWFVAMKARDKSE